jgi:3-oxoacyl-[acyl-carrier protein] reductase
MAGFDLTGRVAVVTGGAQGLGRAMARALAAAGADVAVVARGPEPVTVGRSRPHEPLDPVCDEVRALGRRAEGFPTDLRDAAQTARMVGQVLAVFGRIDILVNNAGGSWGETFRAGPLLEMTAHDLMEAYRVNLVTMFHCSAAVAPQMRRQGRGAIINIASIAGRGASPGQGAYGAAKAAVINLSQTMAIEWGPEVRVNAVAVGGVDSPHRARWTAAPGPATPMAALPAVGRLGTPEDHAGAVVWLASDAAAYISGAVIDANGGRRIV